MPLPEDREQNTLVVTCPYCKQDNVRSEPVKFGHGNRVRLPSEVWLIKAFNMLSLVEDGQSVTCVHCQRKIGFKRQEVFTPVILEDE